MRYVTKPRSNVHIIAFPVFHQICDTNPRVESVPFFDNQENDYMRMASAEELDEYFRLTGQRIEYIEPPCIWRTIDSMPEDQVVDVLLGSERNPDFYQRAYNVHRSNGKYFGMPDGFERYPFVVATHWMPQPPPPKD